MEILKKTYSIHIKAQNDAQENRWLSLVPFVMLVLDRKSNIH